MSSGRPSRKIPIGAAVVLVGGICALVAWFLVWWSSVVVRVTLASGPVFTKSAGPTSTLPLGAAPGKTVWTGTVVALLGLIALALAVAGLAGPGRRARRILGLVAMLAGVGITLVGVAGLARGTSVVQGVVEANLSRQTRGSVQSIEQFEEKIGPGATVTFEAQPGVGVLVAMLGGIAVTTGGWLMASQPERDKARVSAHRTPRAATG